MTNFYPVTQPANQSGCQPSLLSRQPAIKPKCSIKLSMFKHALKTERKEKKQES